MSALPVLYSDTPQMSLCAICPKPGHCCKRFILNDRWGQISFSGADWRIKADELIRKYNLDFEIVGFAHAVADEQGIPLSVIPFFGCTHLTKDGRCSIYATRPNLCRLYTPMEDELCCFGKRK